MSLAREQSSSPSPTWQEKLHAYFSLARVSNSPTVVSNTLAGAAIAGATVLSLEIVLVAIAMVLFYSAGMYLNDLMDYQYDMEHGKDRPLTMGLVSRSSAIAITLLMFGIGSVMLIAVGTRPFIAGMVLIGFIVLYDAWHKGNPISPVIMGANRFMVYIVAYLAVATELSSQLIIAAGLLLLYIVGLTFIAKSELSNDLKKMWPAVLVFLPAVYFGITLLENPVWLILVLAFIAWAAYSVLFIYMSENKQIGRAVVQLIAGVSLFDAMAIATQNLTPFVILALVTFGITLFLQQYIKGT